MEGLIKNEKIQISGLNLYVMKRFSSLASFAIIERESGNKAMTEDFTYGKDSGNRDSGF